VFNTEVETEGVILMDIETAVCCDVMQICTNIFEEPAASIITLK
jgi:hypothetical protein